MVNNNIFYMIMNKRPLSPHLQIYKIFSLNMTSGLSIMQRLTQIILLLSMLYIFAFLICTALGEKYFYEYIKFITSWFGVVSLLGISLCFYFHLLNGIRFLIFNLGFMLDKKSIKISGILVIFTTLGFWLIMWLYIISKIFIRLNLI